MFSRLSVHLRAAGGAAGRVGCYLSAWHSGTQWRCKGAADTALPFKYSASTLNLATSGEDADVFFDGITTGREIHSA